MKNLYLLSLLLMLLFTYCNKKESETPKPANIEELLKGSWREVETTVKEYDKNNNLINTTPNLSPIKVEFENEKVTTTYAETFIPKNTTTYSISKIGNKSYIIYANDSRMFEVTEISKTNMTLVVKQMSSEFNGANFEYMLYTRKLVKL